MRIDSPIAGIPACRLAGRGLADPKSFTPVAAAIDDPDSVQALTDTVQKSDSVRSDLVARIREQVARGEYFTDDTARKTIDAFLDAECGLSQG